MIRYLNNDYSIKCDFKNFKFEVLLKYFAQKAYIKTVKIYNWYK